MPPSATQPSHLAWIAADMGRRGTPDSTTVPRCKSRVAEDARPELLERVKIPNQLMAAVLGLRDPYRTTLVLHYRVDDDGERFLILHSRMSQRYPARKCLRLLSCSSGRL
jgi:hypothetical protein